MSDYLSDVLSDVSDVLSEVSDVLSDVLMFQPRQSDAGHGLVVRGVQAVEDGGLQPGEDAARPRHPRGGHHLVTSAN